MAENTVFTYHPPATIQCVVAFEKWYRLPVCENMDLQTEIAWDHWQHAWHASKLDSDREQADNHTLQAAWRIADEASRELIDVHGHHVDHITYSLDPDELAQAPAIEEAIEYLENRGLATRVDAPDEVLVIFNSEDE